MGLDHWRARHLKVAEGFSCFGAFVDDPAHIRSALEADAKSGLPAVIQVEVEQEAKIWVPQH